MNDELKKTEESLAHVKEVAEKLGGTVEADTKGIFVRIKTEWHVVAGCALVTLILGFFGGALLAMSAIDLAVTQLKVDEGYRQMPYRDSLGNVTVGYGFCVSAGLTKPAALGLLVAQATEIEQQLSTYYWWASLDDARASAVINISFNVGIAGLLHFPKMLSAIAAKDWQGAHDQCLDSDAARLNVERYKRIAQVLLLGAPNVASVQG